MNLSKSIDFLLENAGPVIQYRLKKEILHNLTKTEEENLLEQVYQTPHFKLVQSYVKPNRYIGNGTHSLDYMKVTPLQDGEAAARLLSYYAIPKDHPIITNFVAAMRNEEILREEFSYSNSEIRRFNERFLGNCSGAGTMMLIYAMQALLGYGDDEYMKSFQDTSLNAFTSMIPLTSLDDITKYKPQLKKKYNYPYIEENQYLPCSYHLAVLAYTNAWRTPENINAITNAINHISDIMSDDNCINVKVGSRYIGTGWSFIHPFKNFNVNTVYSIMYRRVLTEIAMLGVGCQAEVIRQSAENVEEAISADGILRFNYVSSAQKRKHLIKWPTAYCDVALEPDYKKKTALDCDMTFWAVQFLHLVESKNLFAAGRS